MAALRFVTWLDKSSLVVNFLSLILVYKLEKAYCKTNNKKQNHYQRMQHNGGLITGENHVIILDPLHLFYYKCLTTLRERFQLKSHKRECSALIQVPRWGK